MVLAEVPLWVVHDGGSIVSHQDDTTATTSTTTGSTSTTTKTKASMMLDTLLTSSSNNSNKKKKCAIYSIDQHPDGTKFATAGGDGTVRIWNTQALFVSNTNNNNNNNNNSTKTTKTTTTTTPEVATPKTVNNNNNSPIPSTTTLLLDAEYHSDNGTLVSTDYSSSSQSSSNSNLNGDDNCSSSSDDDDAADDDNKPSNGTASTNTKTVPGGVPYQNGHSSSSSTKKNENMNTNTNTNKTTNRLLCTLSAHTGSSVLIVRFSNRGHYLASAADDACVCIYSPTTTTIKSSTTLNTNNTSTNLGWGTNNTEQWNRIRLGRGHQLDVVDLAWSPNDTYLVSCSLDSVSPIIVWDVRDLVGGTNSSTSTNSTNSTTNKIMMQPYRILGRNVHTSTVKGIAFDPAGSYLASSGEDPAICIWRADDKNENDCWTLEHKIDSSSGIFRTWTTSTTPSSTSKTSNNTTKLMELSDQSLFRRISWSTDGSFVCSTNSIVKNKHVLATITREGWKTGAANLIGHKQPIVVCRHSSYLLCKKNKKQIQQKSKKKKNAITKKKKHSTKDRDANDDNDSNNSHDDGNKDMMDDEDDDNDNDVDADDHDHADGSDADDDNNNDTEPEYATLLAMGDRRGFVTVWSTQHPRPIFKVQCSESRCTVTDLTWGKSSNTSSPQQPNLLLLLVSLLDGQIVALQFHIPNEMNTLLTMEQKARVFQTKYGIDIMDHDIGKITMNSSSGGSGVGGGSGWNHQRLLGGRNIKLIENALQMSLEEERQQQQQQQEKQKRLLLQNSDTKKNGEEIQQNDTTTKIPLNQQQQQQPQHLSIKSLQRESTTKLGKKRVRPVLMTQDGTGVVVDGMMMDDKRGGKKSVGMNNNEQNKIVEENDVHEPNVVVDPLQNALNVAERAEALASSSAKAGTTTAKHDDVDEDDDTNQHHPTTTNLSPPHSPRRPKSWSSHYSMVLPTIPHSTERLHTADLPITVKTTTSTATTASSLVVVVECRNSTKIPIGSRGTAVPCIDVSIMKGGQSTWKDQIVGSTCSFVAASESMIAIGMVDGSIQLYSTCTSSSSHFALKWECGQAFRSHPPLIPLSGTAIVSLQFVDSIASSSSSPPPSSTSIQSRLLVVTADGSFGVYTIVPELTLLYKGSIMPAMNHMMSSSSATENHRLPNLSRIYITETGKLVLLLSLLQSGGTTSTTGVVGNINTSRSSGISNEVVGVGGSLQAYVYNQPSELWMRISDSRFILSDFYSVLPNTSTRKLDPTSTTPKNQITIAQLDDAVRMGYMQSSLKGQVQKRMNQQGGGVVVDEQVGFIYDQTNDVDNVRYLATRSHCEDRLACAFMFKSHDEFQYWFKCYVQTLTRAGAGTQLRMLTDTLLGDSTIPPPPPPPPPGAMDIDTMILTTENKNPVTTTTETTTDGCCDNYWWLGDATNLLSLDRRALVRTIIIPEMSKNRALQRITNEIALEMDSFQT